MGPATRGEAAAPPLSRGARECLDLLKWYRTRGWKARQEKLAATLKVTERQVQRYYAELQAAGAIALIRGRRTIAEVLILDAAECGKPVQVPESRPDKMSGLVSGLDLEWSAPNQPTLNDLPTEMSGLTAPSLSSLPRLKERDPSRSMEATPGEPRRMKFPVFPRTEGQAVERAVRVCGFEASAVLFQKLARKAQFYGVSGYAIAAHILRAWRRIERQPANHPRSPAWITTAVENELAAASGMRAGEPKSPGSVGQTGTMKEQSGGGTTARVPLAAAAGQGGSRRTPADLPGRPPDANSHSAADAQASCDAPRKQPEGTGTLREEIERLATRKSLARRRGS